MQDPVNNTDGGNDRKNVPINPFVKLLTFIFVLPVVVCVEGTKSLFKKTYSQNDSAIPAIIGVLVSLLAGIGVGYNMGWLGEAAWYKWSSFGVGTTALSFFYLWPLLYLGVFKFAFRVSEKLWKHVNIEAREPYRSYGTTDEQWDARVQNPAWFSKCLMFLGWIGVGVVALGTLVEVAIAVQANQATWGWLGGLLAIVLYIVALVICIAIITAIGWLSGRLAFFATCIGLFFTWYFWAGVSALFVGSWHSFTGGDWGSWGYVAGGVLGLFAAAFVGTALGALLKNARIRLIAAATGFATVYALVPTTNALVAEIPLGAFSFASLALPWLAYALELLFVIGFAFPLVHIFVTHALRKLADLGELMDAAYGESEGGFREVFLNLASIGAAVTVGFFAPAALTAYFGLTTLYTIVPATAGLVYLTYTLGGKLLDVIGNWPFGVAAAIAAAAKTFLVYQAAGYAFGVVGAGAAAAFAGAATFVVIFPLAYILVRKVLTVLGILNVRAALIRAHERACSLIFDLVDEIMEAASNTYGDETPYAKVFAHVTNLAVTAGIAYGSFLGGEWLGFALWLTIACAVVLTVLAYSLAGKALVKWGSGPVGFIVASVAAIIGGIYIHGAQPADWGNGRYALSIIGGLVSGAIVFGGVFPVAYLIVRKILNILSPEAWLLPVLQGAHARISKFFGGFFSDFMVKYRAVREELSKIIDSAKKQYDAIAEQVRSLLNNRK
jgi:hypothetical protein